MSQNYTNAWDRILHSPGEIVPADKLQNVQYYAMSTLLAVLHDLFDRTDVGGVKSGVLFGDGGHIERYRWGNFKEWAKR